MTWRELLVEAGFELEHGHEARILVEEVAQLPYKSLFAHLDEPAPRSARHRLLDLVARRKSGEPLQHIVGHWPFRTLELIVDERALIPRPETEVVVEHGLIELARQGPLGREALVLDLGTGSGAIACAIAEEVSNAMVVAIDASWPALQLAAVNRGRLSEQARRRVSLLCADFGTTLPLVAAHQVALVISNPPYLSFGEWEVLDRTVKDFDPKDALVAGRRGSEAIEAVIRTAPRYLCPGGALVVEIAPHQKECVCARAKDAGARIVFVADDLAGRARVLVARF